MFAHPAVSSLWHDFSRADLFAYVHDVDLLIAYLDECVDQERDVSGQE